MVKKDYRPTRRTYIRKKAQEKGRRKFGVLPVGFIRLKPKMSNKPPKTAKQKTDDWIRYLNGEWP